MYCSKCGRELPPSGICVCQQAGPDQNRSQGYQQAGQAGTGQYRNAPPTGGMHVLSMREIQQFHGGVLSLVFVILYTVSLALTLFSSARSGGAGFFLGLIGSLPAILICVGVWMLFAKSKGTPATTGYSLAAAGLVIRIVYSILLYLVGVILSLVGGGLLREFAYEDSFMTAGIVLALVLVIAAVLTVIYLVKLRRVATSSREVLRGVRFSPQVSLYPVVLLSLSALSSVIRLLASVPLTRYVYNLLDQIAMVLYFSVGSDSVDYLYQLVGTVLGGSVLSTVSSLVSLAVTLLAIVLLVQYRKVTWESRQR